MILLDRSSRDKRKMIKSQIECLQDIIFAVKPRENTNKDCINITKMIVY